MFFVVDAAGHPRDMGLSQGRLLGHAVGERIRRAGLPGRRRRWPSLAPFASGPVRGTGIGRETIRHFAHLTERMDGLARGAGVPVDSVLSLHGRVCALDGLDVETQPAVALSAVGLQDSPGATLARSLPGAGSPGSTLVVRRSRPAVGFESLEVTLPWLVSSLAGVNEAGLTACFVPVERAAAAPAAAAPPPVLLVQECLQRFESVEAALDWCAHRPVDGWATVLLADANGARARVDFAGAERRAGRAGEAPAVAGGPERLADALREAAAGARILDEKALCPPDDSTSSSAWVRLYPNRRTLELRRPAGPRESLSIEI
jgi:hypothetical protein